VKNETKILALRKKQQEFTKKGDFSQATTAKIIADFLEDYCQLAPASP
jgi:hypothetical protein